LSLKGLKLVVDAAHGAGYHVAPDVLHELGAEVISIGCAPDGLNINDGVGATSPGGPGGKAVAEHGADYGIALDGDADRLQLVDAQGRLYNGDELLYVLVADRLAKGEKVPGAVGTLMTNMAVELALQSGAWISCAPRWATATCWKSWSAAAGSWAARARATCWHWIATPRATAWSAPCRCLQAVVRSGRSLAHWLDGVTLFPQRLINVRLQPGQDWRNSPRLAAVQKDVDGMLVGQGRVLIRPSGTEPLAACDGRGAGAALADRCAQMLVDAVSA
jgi:phosphoglucosamine mutase